MKIEQKEISKKLKQLKDIIPPRETTQNQGILFKNNELVANNLELGLSAKLDVESSEEFIIPPKAINMISSLTDEVIDVRLDKNKIIIKSNSGTSRFQTFPVDNFPMINSENEGEETFVCDSEEFAEAIGRVMYACSVHSTKPTMTGVLLEGDGKYLNLVACGGYRLAWNQIECSEKFSAIIPKTSLQKVLSIGFKNEMRLHTSGNRKAVIKSGDYTAYTGLLEGEYIKYRTMFKDNGIKTTVERTELIASLNRALICIDNKASNPIVVEVKGDVMNISLNTSESNFNENIYINGEVENIKIGFNPRFMIDVLKSFSEETLDLYFGTALEPLIVQGKTMKALLLPVRLRN